MYFVTVAEIAKQWGISERTVRRYCACGRISGAVLSGSKWNIPANATSPGRASRGCPNTLLDRLQAEKEARLSGGIYHRVQIDLTYHSNHMEGSRLTHDQTRFIFDTNTINAAEGPVSVDDILETTSHFRCIDWVIDNAKRTLCEKDIKNLHFMLKNGTSDSKKEWFATGEYKLLPNEAGESITTAPEHVAEAMSSLLAEYNAKPAMTIEDLIDFHVRFERIHPFQDGNGRIGRLILFKECLHWAIVPFIIEDDLKMFYYRGLREWDNMRGYLTDTCLTAQDRFKKKLDYFQIRY